MSTLNSPEDALRALVLHDTKPGLSTLIDNGLDIDILEKMWGIIKPHMDYLRGYKSLVAFFEKQDSLRMAPLDLEPMDKWVEEWAWASAHTQVLMIANVRIQPNIPSGNGTYFSKPFFDLEDSEVGRYEVEWRRRYRVGRIRTFLNRKGLWTVWLNVPTSTFEVFGKPREACEYIRSLHQDGWSYGAADTRLSYLVPSVPIEMSRQLVRLHEQSIEAKRELLQKETDSLSEMNAVLGRTSI